MNDKRIEVKGIPVIYPEAHSKTAAAIAEAVEKTIPIITDCWNLSIPKELQVHVLTDLKKFVDQTVPKHLRLLVNWTKPFWEPCAQRAFKLSGGWMLPWRGCPSVGVKPPELLARSTSKLGDLLFAVVSDPLEKVKHLTCHEFTHACTAHLRLPPWLNEGLAMRTVDHMVGYQTVLKETETLVQFDQSVLNSRSYRRIKPGDCDNLIRLYATGYWITRRLEQENPSILGDLLKRKHPIREVNRIVETSLGVFHSDKRG